MFNECKNVETDNYPHADLSAVHLCCSLLHSTLIQPSAWLERLTRDIFRVERFPQQRPD